MIRVRVRVTRTRASDAYLNLFQRLECAALFLAQDVPHVYRGGCFEFALALSRELERADRLSNWHATPATGHLAIRTPDLALGSAGVELLTAALPFPAPFLSLPEALAALFLGGIRTEM